MIRVALVGCGRIAPTHLTGLRSLASRAEVVALCDPNAALREDRRHHFDVPRGFDSLTALLDWGQFDVAAVLTPPTVREEVCRPLLEAGKHVLVEKPFTHTVAEARRIVQAAEAAGVVLAVSQNFRWKAGAPQLRQAVRGGRLGRVMSYLRVHTVWRDETEGWRNTTDKLALSVMGVHWLDAIRWALDDEGTRVYTASQVSGLLTSRGEDITATVITMRSGAVVTLVHHWASHARGLNDGAQVDGTEASVTIRHGELIWRDRGGQETRESFPDPPLPESIAQSWTELLDSLEQGRAPHHSGRDNLWTVALLEGAYRSIETGQAVSITASPDGSPILNP